jgi:hypothetical protein
MTSHQSYSLAYFFLAVDRHAFCQSSFWWIYFYGRYKSTKKETGKLHLCAVGAVVQKHVEETLNIL